jgi:hypothetical protein
MKLKKAAFAIVLISLAVLGCHKNSKDTEVTPARSNNVHPMATLEPPFICMDSANKMLGSYLNSIGSNDIKSITLDAGALRDYLSNTNITKVKVMFAHRLDYINTAGANQSAGYDYAKLTIILAGISSAGDYIYNGDNGVLDNGSPCPYSCDVVGTASSNLLQ